ncbi:MAG TPA: hypothetical protein VFX12_09930 [Vicinamibacterales bacterium]|nr:hypothetical protein [Vicinamibacterales bacterium]
MRRYRNEHQERITELQEAFLREQLGWRNPADAPFLTRKEARRAATYDVLAERREQQERYIRLADKGANIWNGLASDPAHHAPRAAADDPYRRMTRDEMVARLEALLAYLKTPFEEAIARSVEANWEKQLDAVALPPIGDDEFEEYEDEDDEDEDPHDPQT